MQRMPRYCLPIQSGDSVEIERIIANHRGTYSSFEFWLDLISNSSPEYVAKLSQELGSAAIFLFRRPNLEPISLSADHRKELIKVLANSKSYLDLDLKTQTDDLAGYRALSASNPLILSYHNYTETPPADVLREIAAELSAESPTIVKLSTFCKTAKDAITLLSLQQELQAAGRRVTVLGMGEYGSVTRIFGSLWGNEIIFAPVTKEAASAPGQLTRDELEMIFSLLGQKR